MVKLKEGDKAPLFKLETYNAGTIDLSEQIGEKKIVLIFSRYFGCPICLMDLRELVENVEKIKEKGAILLYITQSEEKIAKGKIEEEKISFPVIPSTHKKLYAQYGLGKFGLGTLKKIPGKIKATKKLGIEHGPKEGKETQQPGQFVIDKDGKLIHAQKSWLDINAILKVL